MIGTNSELMDEFLDFLAGEIRKSGMKKNIFKSIVKTVGISLLTNLITLPLGRISAVTSIHRTNSKKAIKVSLEQALYWSFDQKTHSDDASLRTAFVRQLDSFSREQKINVVNFALGKPKQFREYVAAWISTQKKSVA